MNSVNQCWINKIASNIQSICLLLAVVRRTNLMWNGMGMAKMEHWFWYLHLNWIAKKIASDRDREQMLTIVCNERQCAKSSCIHLCCLYVLRVSCVCWQFSMSVAFRQEQLYFIIQYALHYQCVHRAIVLILLKRYTRTNDNWNNNVCVYERASGRSH